MDEALWFDVMPKSICLPVRKGGEKGACRDSVRLLVGSAEPSDLIL